MGRLDHFPQGPGIQTGGMNKTVVTGSAKWDTVSVSGGGYAFHWFLVWPTVVVSDSGAPDGGIAQQTSGKVQLIAACPDKGLVPFSLPRTDGQK